MHLQPKPAVIRTFAAIDFETADHRPDSACAVGVVRCEGDAIVDRRESLIRPPRERVRFTHIHGLTWEVLQHAPTFREAWPRVSEALRDVDAVVAHGADFDRAVLITCCARASLRPPRAPFVCTRVLSATVLGAGTTALKAACAATGVSLVRPHDALADAEACALLFLALRQRGTGA